MKNSESIDRFLPEFDVTEVVEYHVDAPPAVTYQAILETDLRDPIIDALFAVREIALRVRRKWRGESFPPARAPVNFRNMDGGAGPGWTRLAEKPGVEIVLGSVGRFWRSDYGGRPIAAEEFAAFHEPGYAKLAIALSVRPLGALGSLLRYEARTATTDEKARRAFRRYWRVIRPGVALVMRRAVGRIRREAERQVEMEDAVASRRARSGRRGGRLGAAPGASYPGSPFREESRGSRAPRLPHDRPEGGRHY